MTLTPSENPAPQSEVVPAVTTPEIDYTEKLLELGLQESQISPDLLERFKNALRTYQTGPDNNMALLEERIFNNLDRATASTEEKITALTQWISTQEARAPVTSSSETLEEFRNRQINEAVTRVETTIREQAAQKGFFAEMLVDYVIDTQRQMREKPEDFRGLSGIFAKIGVALAFAFVGGKELYENLGGEIEAAKNATLPEVELPNITDTIPEVSEETRDLVKYQAGIGLILSLSENDDGNTNIRELLLSKKVQESKFSEIMSESFSIEDANGDDIATMKAALTSQEGLIDSVLKAGNPNWRELPLLEVFESIGVYAASFIDIGNITPDTILSGDFNIGKLSFGEGFTVGGSLGSLFEQQKDTKSSPFYGVSNGLFMQLFLENGKKITDLDVESLMAGNTFQEKAEDREFQSKFVRFGKGFIDVIISDFYLGPDEYKEEFTQYIREKSLSYNEVLELMVLTGGSLDVSSYNNATKTIIYAKIWKILGEQDMFGHPLRENTYNFALIEIFTNGVSEGYENVPHELKVLAHNVLNKSIDAISSAMEEAASMGFEMLSSVWNGSDWKTKLGIMAGSGVAIYILIQSRWARGASVGLAAGAGSAIVAGLVMMADSAWANPAFREENPELETREELLNTMIAEVSAAGVDMSAAVEDIRAGRTTHDIDRTQIAPVNLMGDITTTTDITPSPDTLPEREYPWIYFDGAQLGADGMTPIHMEGDIVSQEFGVLKIERNRATKEVKFYINGEERNVYFGSQGGFMDGVADGMLGDGGIFVKNNEGEIFLAIFNGDDYRYISLQELETSISQHEKGELMISEDVYMYWDLMMG